MSRNIGATRSPKEIVSLGPCWQNPSRRASILGEARKPILEGFSVFETTPLLHGAFPHLSRAGAQPAFSSPIDTTSRAVTAGNMRLVG
jgi:hypothetical protein